MKKFLALVFFLLAPLAHGQGITLLTNPNFLTSVSIMSNNWLALDGTTSGTPNYGLQNSGTRINFQINGANTVYFDNGGKLSAANGNFTVQSNGIISTTNGSNPALQNQSGGTSSLRLESNTANSGTNINTIINSQVALTGSTELLELQNNGVRKVSVDNAGKGIFVGELDSQTAIATTGVGENICVNYNGSQCNGMTDDGSNFLIKTQGSTVMTMPHSNQNVNFAGTIGATFRIQFTSTAIPTCNSAGEGTLTTDSGSGGTNTLHRTRLCLCTSDGAASPSFAWRNIGSGTVGTATACND